MPLGLLKTPRAAMASNAKTTPGGQAHQALCVCLRKGAAVSVVHDSHLTQSREERQENLPFAVFASWREMRIVNY
jgi:hypothetical protein